jgi:hypothetical protein
VVYNLAICFTGLGEGGTYFVRFTSDSGNSLFVVEKSLVDCTIKVLFTSPIIPLENYFLGAFSSYLFSNKLTLPLTTAGFVLTSDLLARPFVGGDVFSSYSRLSAYAWAAASALNLLVLVCCGALRRAEGRHSGITSSCISYKPFGTDILG